MKNNIVRLSDRRPPVYYTVQFEQFWDGSLTFIVEDVKNDIESREAVADALLRASNRLMGVDE